MTTQKLYKILDKELPKDLCYGLHKLRNVSIWRIQMWQKQQLYKLGILAPYIQDELWPDYYDMSGTISRFLGICKKAQTDL